MKVQGEKETRLDRIEKGLELLLQGTSELREEQRSYTAKRRETQKKIDAEILDLKESQRKTDEQLSRTIKKLDDIGRNLADLGLVQGEDLFYRNIRYLFKA